MQDKGKRMIEITYDNALSALNDAIVDMGADFVYEKGTFEVEDPWGDVQDKPLCAYLHNDENGNPTVPGCLVGHALLKLGVSKEFLAKHNAGPTASDVAQYMEAEGIASVTRKARTLFGWAQGRQDDGDSWGEAVKDAVEHVAAFNWNDDEVMLGIKTFENV